MTDPFPALPIDWAERIRLGDEARAEVERLKAQVCDRYSLGLPGLGGVSFCTKGSARVVGELVNDLRAESEVLLASLPTWPFHMRELIRKRDVDGMKAEAALREEWLKGVHDKSHEVDALRAQFSKLEAEVERLKADLLFEKTERDELTERQAALGELLAALEGIVDWYDGGASPLNLHEQLAAARSAILKAKKAAE